MGYSDGSDSENEINEAQHSSLLEAVSQLDNKQRVKPPSRKESSYQVSEFHLAKSDSEKKDVHITKLAKVLDQRGNLYKIGKKLRSVKRKAKTLAPPLEKPVAARIHRSVGFENVRKQLGRWNAVIEANRAADHLKFPLTQATIQWETTNDFVEKLKSQTRTPLEAAMDEILNKSPAVQEERKEQAEYQLTLAEMRERRKELARLRAQQSYMAAKARRQNKIKSKKYHRIQRRERIRQQLKEFETLQKVDPEAALKQLEQLERTRAEERVTLRHRNTGQWARNKAVRAKYDKESRQELAQQLAVSRDLTQKVQTGDSSDEQEDDDNDKATAPTSVENPWIAPKTTSEVEEFISGYRKFWDEKNKKLSKENNVVTPKSSKESQEIIRNGEQSQLQNHYEDINTTVASVESESLENENVECESEKNLDGSDIELVSDDAESKSQENTFSMGEDSSKTSIVKRKSSSDSINAVRKQELVINNDESESEENTFSKDDDDDYSKASTVKSKLSSGSNKIVRKKSNNKLNKAQNSFLESDNDQNSTVISTTSAWVVTLIGEEQKTSKNDSLQMALNKPEVEIDQLFDNVERKLKKKVKTKLKRVREILDKEKIRTTETQPESDDEGPSLKIKKTVVRADLDEELIEESHNVSDQNDSSNINLKALVAQSKTHENGPQPSSDNIDPNRFIAIKPKHLKTELPDIVTGGNEGIDDNEEEDEDDTEERQKTITEAFADDDVVAEFRKEKEEAEEKSQPENIDLTLPGWGEWGGKNLPMSKRKKRRFVIKFPKVPPRKDANKGTVIISEEKNDKVKVHQVNELPFPFTSVKDFEASIRAPLGNTWIPETAHVKLVKPQVVTKLGTVIKPMDEDMLVNTKVKIQP